MNCKPGDLAVIVQDEKPPVDIGKIVKVLEFEGYDDDGFAIWTCDATSTPLRYWDGVRFRRSKKGVGIPDAWLRPIRPQSDDAEDEMLLKTGLPERNGVAA